MMEILVQVQLGVLFFLTTQKLQRMNKLILVCGNGGVADRKMQKAKRIKGVSYCTKYMRNHGQYNVMICGEFDVDKVKLELNRRKKTI